MSRLRTRHWHGRRHPRYMSQELRGVTLCEERIVTAQAVRYCTDATAIHPRERGGRRGLAIRGGIPGRSVIAVGSLSARCGCASLAQAAAGACGPIEET